MGNCNFVVFWCVAVFISLYCWFMCGSWHILKCQFWTLILEVSVERSDSENYTKLFSAFLLICLITNFIFQDVIFSFTPHQIGTFKVKQVIDIIGTAFEKNNLQALKTKSFHQIYLSFIGVCKSKRKNILFKINPGKMLKR